MNNQPLDVKALAIYMSQASVFDFVNAAKDDKQKRSRIEQMKQKFLASSNFSSATANFSAAFDTSDVGNPEMTDYSVYDNCSTFAEYSAKAKEVVAFAEIRKLSLTHSIKDNLKQWILKKNNISKRNRAAKLEAQKAFDNHS
jgi:uncharacterized membrane-anchored protein YjiN (DUF445 family)